MSKRRKTKRKSSVPTWYWLVPVLVVGAGLAYWVSSRTSASRIEGVQTVRVSGGHRQGPVNYDQHPPAGGVHAGVWINCGIYDTQVETEKAVHSLEHGAAWITYQPDLATSEVETLRTLVGNRRYVLLSPYMYVPLPKPIVAVAWGVRLEVDSASDPRLAQFLQQYANGRQAPEPGAACTGGEGNPL